MRELLYQWVDSAEAGEASFVMFVNLIDRLGLPRSPFFVTLLALLIREDPDYMPVNETAVMARFMETILGKLDPQETQVDVYDFTDKEAFLSALAVAMFKTGGDSLTIAAFDGVLEQFFGVRKLSRAKSRFDDLFFNCGILTKESGEVYFRYRIMGEYYLAKAADRDKAVLNELVAPGGNPIAHGEALAFLCGIGRDRKDVLEALQHHLSAEWCERRSGLEWLEAAHISVDWAQSAHDAMEQWSQLEVPAEVRDAWEDAVERRLAAQRETASTQEAAGTVARPDGERALGGVLGWLVFCRCLRNSGLVDGDVKDMGVDLAVKSAVLWWAVAGQAFESAHDDGELRTVLAAIPPEEDRIERLDTMLLQLAEIAFPLAMQGLLTQFLGSRKLEQVVRDYLAGARTEHEEFMALMMCADLDIGAWMDRLSQWIKRVESRDLVQLCVVKLMYYLSVGYFGEVTTRRIEPLLVQAIGKSRGTLPRLRGGYVGDIRKAALTSRWREVARPGGR